MIRGPVLPQSRDALWSLVVGRLDAIERGLSLVFEAFDCNDGIGSVDGLARDAAGAPVLMLLAVEGDALVAARALGAASFLERVGDALGAAVPEAAFCPGARGRVLVVATDRHAAACDLLLRQPAAGVQVCRLEPFRVGGSERFAVRWLSVAPPNAVEREAAIPAPAPAFAVPRHLQELWAALHEVVLRIDPGIRIDGDRYLRRITWNGQPVAEVHVVDGAMQGSLADGASRALAGPADVRAFTDQLLRAYARLAGLTIRRADVAAATPVSGCEHAPRHAVRANGPSRSNGDDLRAVAAAARLTPEEYSALGDPTSAVGGEADVAATADDVARIVAAQEGSWPQPRQPD